MSLRHALLVVLSQGPRTGYQLASDLQGTVAMFWTARHSQIYPELAAMRADGLVDFEASRGPGPRARKTYSITEQGRAVLREWFAEPHRTRPPKDELVLAAFGASAAEPMVLAGRFRDEAERLRRRLREYEEIQARLDQLPGAEDPTRPEFGWQLSLLHGFASARARLDWCLEAIARLERAQKTR